MKRFFLLFTLFLFVSLLNAQEYQKLINYGNYTVEEIRTTAEKYFDSVGRERGSGYKSFRRWLYFAERMMDETGKLKSPEFYYNELNKYQAKINTEYRTSSNFVGNWEDLGPTYWNATTGYNPGVGRITSIAIEKENTLHIIAGSQTGGVWKTMDGGQNWQVLTDNLSNIDVYSLAIDPTNNSIYYWGSRNGEIFTSTDAGATWNFHSRTPDGGLVNKILIDPNDPLKMYVSVEWSGLYKSTDGGLNWARIHPEATTGFDFEFKPDDSNVIYASGAKIYKSIDGGKTFSVNETGLENWSQEQIIGNSTWNTKPNFEDRILPKTGNGFVHIIKYDYEADVTILTSNALDLSEAENPVVTFSYIQEAWESDQDELRVLYKSNEDQEWQELAHYTESVSEWTEVSLALPNPTENYFIGFEGTVKYGYGIALDDISIVTDNNGTILSEGFENSSTFLSDGAKMIGVSRDTPSIVYVLAERGGIFEGIYKSLDEGETFTKLDHGSNNYLGYATNADDQQGQAPRDMDIVVNPKDANDVHIGGINSWRSTDGGETFNITSQWTPNNANSLNIGYCHADIDIMLFTENERSSTLFIGTDGGIFRAGNPTNVNSNYYTDITTGMSIRQFYKIGISQTDPILITGGSQDNGSSTLGVDGNWTDWWGADGMEGFIDKDNPDIWYGTSQFGNMVKTLDAGLSITYIDQPDGKGGSGGWNWVVPFEQDPIRSNKIYAAFDQVYESTNGGEIWLSASQNFGANIDHFKVAPSDNTIKYLAIDGDFYSNTDGSDVWKKTSPNLEGYGRINDIAIHPTNPAKVAIATTNSGKVYLSENYGLSWTSIGFNLPDFVAQAVVWQDNGKEGLYVGMNYGIYYIDNEVGNEWVPFSNGLPNVRINELEINTLQNKIYAATYGRGLWSSDLYGSTLSSPEVDALGKLNVYPNPVKNQLNVQWDSNESSDIRIYNVLGKLVYFEKDCKLINNHKIETSNFSTGIYYLKINTSIGEMVKKIVIK